MKLDPAAFPSEVANRVLGREAWARDKLAAHAGRTFVVRIGPATAAFLVGSDGSLAPAPADAADVANSAADLALAISPLHLPALLSDPRQWNEHVVETGDAALGGTLKELAQTLPWFVEAAFARVLGPVAGQRVADAGRHLLAFPAHAATRLADSAGRYARDEAGLVVRHDELRHLAEQAEALAHRVDALEARVAALTASP